MKSLSNEKIEKGTLDRIISKPTQVLSSKTTFFLFKKKRKKFYFYFVSNKMKSCCVTKNKIT